MLRSNTTVGRCRHLRYRFSSSFFFQTQDVHLFSTTTTTSIPLPLRHEYYQPYKQAVKRLLLSTEFKSKKKSVLGQRLWTEDMFTRYEKWLLQKESAVTTRCKLLKKNWIEYLTHGGKEIDSTSIRKQTILELSSQSETLQSKIFATNDHANALLMSKSVARIQTFVFNNLVRTCLEGGGGLPVVWLKMKESGTVIDTKQLNVLNNILDENSTLVNSSELSSKEKEEILVYHDLLTGNISENTYSKRCVQAIFTHHCDNGDIESASSLLRVMKSSHISSAFTLDDYMKVISMLIGNGQLRNATGLKMFDEITTGMIGQVGSISQSSTIHLYNILSKEANLDELTSRLSEYPLDEVRRTIAKPNEILACRVSIDPLSSTCPVTKIQLYNYTITLEERKQMFEDILALGDVELKRFSKWLDNQTDHPFTVILDAANIGSVERMVDILMKAGEYPLVILSEKVATLNHERAALARRLKNRGILYTTPDGTDDDVFSMLATVCEQRVSCLIHGAVSPVLISNDRFTQYRNQMRLGRLWYKHYCFNQGRQKGSAIGRISELPSKVFKRRVTCSDWPVVDVKDEYSSKALLIPVRGWRYQERLMLSIPTAHK